jgi:thiol-disulfide isomerase/thioredoxin
MRNTICISFTLLFTIQLASQELKSGDKFPDIEINNVLNYPGGKLKISDFRGKWVVLDFWGFLCLSCLKSFPKIDSLQKRFRDSIQIILVNTNTQNETTEFFARRKKLHKPDLAMITGDRWLRKIFPHVGVPHYVWIDPAGIYRATSGSEYLNVNYIRGLLQTGFSAMQQRNKRIVRESLFDSTWAARLGYFSYIALHTANLHVQKAPPYKLRFQLVYTGLTIPALYQKLYDELTRHQYRLEAPGRILVEMKDKSKYLPPENKFERRQWKEANTYVYQLMLPAGKEAVRFEIMKQDLERYFSVEARLETRSIQSLVMEKITANDLLRTKGLTSKDNFSRTFEKSTTIDSVRSLINRPFAELSARLSHMAEDKFGMPFIDNTNYYGHIDIQLNGEVLDEFDLDRLNSELFRFGLSIQKKYWPQTVLVLNEKQ